MLSTSPNLPVPTISRFWENIRKPRVERIKAYAAWNTRRFAGKRGLDSDVPVSKYTDSDWKAINEIQADLAGDFTSPAFFKWAHDFDVIEQVSSKIFRLEYLKGDVITTLELTSTTWALRLISI